MVVASRAASRARSREQLVRAFAALGAAEDLLDWLEPRITGTTGAGILLTRPLVDAIERRYAEYRAITEREY